MTLGQRLSQLDDHLQRLHAGATADFRLSRNLSIVQKRTYVVINLRVPAIDIVVDYYDLYEWPGGGGSTFGRIIISSCGTCVSAMSDGPSIVRPPVRQLSIRPSVHLSVGPSICFYLEGLGPNREPPSSIKKLRRGTVFCF